MNDKYMEELEVKRIINEILFLKDDLIIKQEIGKKLEIDFYKHLNSIIKKDGQLKQQWNESLAKKGNIDVDSSNSNSNINTVEESKYDTPIIEVEDVTEEKIEGKSPKSDSLKKLYRDIVKITHPDKITDEYKNSVYMQATESYMCNDIMELIYYAHKLGVYYNPKIINVKEVRDNINNMREKINMYEMSFPFKWYYNNKSEETVRRYIAYQFLTS